MSTDEQDARASGSVPNAFGNAIAWKWSREMPRALKPGLLTLLYTLRSMANANGELRFHGDHKPIRIQDIARSAGADEKDTRDRLDAAIRAGVVVVKGERRRGVRALYVIVLAPCPDWPAAVAYLDGVKQLREEARQKRESARKAAPWAEDEGDEFGGRSPELESPEFGGPPPELTGGTAEEVRGTAPRPSSGDRPLNGSGDRPPNNPGVSHGSSHDGAEVVSQPQVVGAPGSQDHSPQEDPNTTAATAPSPIGSARCRECSIPLLRPGRHLCHGCETYLAKHPDHERHSA